MLPWGAHNVDCFLYSDAAEEPPHLEPGMGFLKLEALKDALGETMASVALFVG